MKVDINAVKELRNLTGAGVGDCKEALNSCGGDIEKAKNYLREQGIAKAYKKSTKDVSDGLVAVHVNGNQGAILEVNSETDFVARNEKFQKLVLNLVSLANQYAVEDIEDFLKHEYVSGTSIHDEIMTNIAVIGENIHLNKIGYLSVNAGVVGGYIHSPVVNNLGKIGAIVALESTADNDKLNVLARQIAMHIVAARPEALSVDLLDKDILDKEREIIKKQVDQLNKPVSVAERIIDGRIAKFYQDVVLLEQIFVMDNQLTISELIKKKESELGASINLVGYKLFVISK
ncbi:translation elongation factor Ts [Ehrlichia chaffeensis str. Heartland]|uniref:Elongation factor Ts n=1 Tax=Ehrlichia chaffeensis (strain ATCC CRL-10679 / Arkansas) TaxID=205920 RepID=EFTS_EHRCR|nr:translation elongation factor Ts [Ehrlichia chaffeensis]Q2GGV3.1 RecName: Full=Elongation factor Ts; Short=EF-Ts [Ehrlichia chaffeensis str. Arkansas]ABD45414.1 translation elongation factor Ts [Ehrlichia chaffeensis str. Arkansas]AHX03609.1 translation elongation factor Ts [Ehrlichia chaffeensis str. Heartland]AHX05669.1 translation elongation factor Ts [Ehrlichia chaffeensis str. Jax]AHX06660.1 translation elongation factor Ts [Ehrlichia chaffeensis str. Liberty]AHX07514.1 translation el